MSVATDARVTFRLKDLRTAFGFASRVVPAKSPKPILTSVRLDLEPGFATFSGTDLEQGIRHKIACDYSDDPTAVVLPKAITDSILRVAEAEELTFDFERSSVTITCPSAEWTVKTADAMEYPEVPEFDVPTWHSIEADRISEAVRRTIYAVDPVTLKYALSGIRLEPLLTAMAFDATDAVVIAHQQVEASVTGSFSVQNSALVVPTKAMRLLLGVIPDSMDLVDIGFPDANRVFFRCGGTTLYSRLVSGRFPNWRNGIPASTPLARVPIGTGSFRRSVARATTHATEETRRITLAFSDMNGGELLMSCRGPAGVSESRLAIPWEQDDVTFDVNPKNLSDMLDGLGDDTTPVFEIRDNGEPLIAKLEDTFLGLICTLHPEPK